MECWSDQLTMSPPMITSADQQTVAQPWFEKAIFVGLLDVDTAVQDQFNVEWIGEENDQLGTDPNASHILVGFTQFQGQF